MKIKWNATSFTFLCEMNRIAFIIIVIYERAKQYLRIQPFYFCVLYINKVELSSFFGEKNDGENKMGKG